MRVLGFHLMALIVSLLNCNNNSSYKMKVFDAHAHIFYELSLI